MDEAEKYQQRLQAITEKRRIQEEEEKVRREMEEEWLKVAQHKRKSLREQWLKEEIPSSAEDPKLPSVIPIPQAAEKSAEETQSSERQMKKVEKTENRNEESSPTGENEPSVLSADNMEKPVQAYQEEEDRNVLEVLEVEVERNLLSEAAEENTEEKRGVKTEEKDQLALDAVEPVAVPHHSLQHKTTPDEAHGSLANRKTELIMAEDNTEAEEEEWEIVTCSPEESLDLVLTSDLTQAETGSHLGHKDDGAILKVEQVFIVDEEDDMEIGASEVLNLVAGKKSDLEETPCESRAERSQEERSPEGVLLQTLCFEKQAHAGTSTPLQDLSSVLGIISEEPPVCSVECKQSLPHLPAHTTRILKEVLGGDTEYKGDQNVSGSMIINMECKEASGAEDEVFQYISLDRKGETSPSSLQREPVAQSPEQESEIQILMPPSAIPESVTSTKRQPCHCCIVL